MNQWLTDDNGNKCLVQFFGSREEAQAALNSLKKCKNCINCSDCFSCFDCFDCSNCSRCYDCHGCFSCFGCSDCSDCFDCSGCSRCSDCSDCSGCYCCSRCSYIARVDDRKDIIVIPSGDGAEPSVPSIPAIGNIHQRVYEAVLKPQALNMEDWHTCNTTHCRAGWVVHLAGELGYALERFHGTLLAAQLIYRESGAPINPCRFFDTNEDALADMKALAEAEAAYICRYNGKANMNDSGHLSEIESGIKTEVRAIERAKHWNEKEQAAAERAHQ